MAKPTKGYPQRGGTTSHKATGRDVNTLIRGEEMTEDYNTIYQTVGS